MTDTLWHKPSAGHLHPLLAAYTVGDDPTLDLALLPYDIQASKAHAKGLKKIGILTEQEEDRIFHALSDLNDLAKQGKVKIEAKDEDCHTVIEHYLTEKLGPAGSKIHTSRSRNDQVLTALRLFMKAHLATIHSALLGLAAEFLAKAEEHNALPFPGYSHTQQAMLGSLGHYYASFTEHLIEDAEFLQNVLAHIDKNPLGSAAGFGVALPLDREGTTTELNFAKIQINSLACQTSRGKFEAAVLEALVQIMMTLGRFANDMLFFTARECDFFTADDTLVTGSSIMPQKRNLDGLEVLRGYGSIVMGHQHAIQNIAFRLLSGYNRDLQLLKKPLMESLAIVTSSIAVAGIYLQGLTPKEGNIRKAITPAIVLADIATSLAAEKGIPFRDAYLLASSHTPDAPDLDRNLQSKISMGAAGNLCLEEYRKRLAALGK